METVEVDGERVELTAVSVGNPHAVVRAEPDRDELLRLGPQLETNDRFPERTNVQLVRVDGPHDVTVAVWERGAGETSASGSSAVAVACCRDRERLVRELPSRCACPAASSASSWTTRRGPTLVGPAEQICEGELRL